MGKRKDMIHPRFLGECVIDSSGRSVRPRTAVVVLTRCVSVSRSHPAQVKAPPVCTVFTSGSTKSTRSTRGSTTASPRSPSPSRWRCPVPPRSCDSRSNLEDRPWVPRGEAFTRLTSGEPLAASSLLNFPSASVPTFTVHPGVACPPSPLLIIHDTDADDDEDDDDEPSVPLEQYRAWLGEALSLDLLSRSLRFLRIRINPFSQTLRH